MRNVLLPFSLALVLVTAGCSNAQSGPIPEVTIPTDIEAPAFNARIAKGDARLIDVRTPAEFESGHIKGAKNMDWSAPDYEKNFATLDVSRPVLLYCAAGGRSGQAKEYLEEKGFNVTHLVDGITGWKKAGLPIVTD